MNVKTRIRAINLLEKRNQYQEFFEEIGLDLEMKVTKSTENQNSCGKEEKK